ncbi:thioredoxin family protein [Proteiniborus sp.]|uniref:thioredoxin family protein n=1 Tax=Proteiniborus sp. TaxID=2079015 RepID=UPI0033236DDB
MVDAALKKMNLNYRYELIENPIILKEMGITNTPAMVINGKIILEGRIPNVLEMMEILKKAFNE